MKKVITKNEYISGMGLMALAKEAYKRVTECENALAALLEIEGEFSSYGHLSDQIWGGDCDLDVVLKNEGIEIV